MTKHTLLTLLILLGLAAGLFSFAHRYAAESRNRRVELVTDYADAQALANTKRQSLDDVLPQLKAAGITTVAITEDTLDTLRAAGVLTYRRERDATVLKFAPDFLDQRDRVLAMMQHKTGLPVAPSGADSLRVSAPWPQFNGTPIGLDEVAVQTVRRNGLLVAPRLVNYTGITPGAIAWELGQAQGQIGAASLGPFIFAGAAVLGNRGLIKDTAQNFNASQLTYGTVEFAKTFGDELLTRMAEARAVRVHSIGTDEMGLMTEPVAVERFIRAARERNIRVLYVRLFLSGLDKDADGLNANIVYISEIKKGLEDVGLTIGGAHPFVTDPKPNILLRLLMGIGVMAGFTLLVSVFTGLQGRAFWGVLIVSLAIGLALAVPGTSPKGREILALVAACVFPTLGLCILKSPPAPNNGGVGTEISSPLAPPELGAGGGAVLLPAFLEYARMTLATLAGVVFVVGLLSGRLFLLKVDEFVGVKAVLVVPVVLTLLYYGLGIGALGQSASWDERKAKVLATLRRLYDEPLLLGRVVVGAVALVALALFVARSGNDPGVGVSATELKLRSLLDKYLGVRPRTKEFLLGHPALLFGLAASYARRYQRAIIWLLVIGAIGQSSLLDTFCHLHTPLDISLHRALLGWALGAIIGAVAFVIAEGVRHRREAA